MCERITKVKKSRESGRGDNITSTSKGSFKAKSATGEASASQMHLIVTSEELCRALTHVDNERLTVAKEKAEKLFLFEDTSGKGLRARYSYYI